jgi:mono/diheme cytochrome c family protein
MKTADNLLKFSVTWAVVLAFSALPAAAADGAGILKAQCAECHALTQPEHQDLDHIWTRKGPDLFYAGIKFNKPWLTAWLQNPQRIRPAGEFYERHIKRGDKNDVVDESTLTPHVKLSAQDASAVADELMKLTGPPNLVEKGAFKGAPVSKTMGEMFFGKLRGCGACHQAKPGTGGFSGPELYDAGARLQPDYIYAYIKDPQKIDPHVWMPTLPLSEADLQRLTGYLVQLGTEGEAK